MSQEIQWIKDGIEVCVNFFSHQQFENEVLFRELEKRYKELTSKEKQNVGKILKSQFVLEDLIYVYSFFVKYMEIEEFQEELLDFLANANLDCYTGSMMELQTYVDISGLYDKKRELHKINVKRYQDELNIDCKYIEKNKRNKNRIVIITEQILNEKHAPTKSVLDFATTIKKLGYEVVVFVCPSDSNLVEGLWHNAISMNSISGIKNELFSYKYRDIVLDMYQINMNDEGITHYKKMIEFIYEYNPLFVYSMGLMNPIGDVLNKFTTVVSRKYTLGLPLSEAEILVKIDGANETDNADSIICKNQKIFTEKKSITYFEPSDKEVSRKQFGFPEDGFLIVVVGNRLDEEIDEEFAALVKSILLLEDSINFAIVGKVDIAKKLFEDKVFDGRVYYLDYCSDLMSMYKIVNLYINPKRYGGGYSALMALVSGVPVITLPNCDVAFNSGENYIVKSYHEMYLRVKQYIFDVKYYQKAKESTSIFVKEYSFDKMMDEVEKNLNQIIELVMNE